MEAVLTRSPRYARGLRVIRIGVFVMLGQLVLSVVMMVKALGAGTSAEAFDAFKWVQYFLWANLGATVAMMIGSVLALPDFRLARLPTRLVVLAAAGFAVAAGALWWTHHVIDVFIQVALDPASSGDDVVSAAEGLSSLKLAAVVKDLAYVIGLISVIRTVRQSAVANEQLGLRDAASHLTGLLVMMLVGDLFYQLTYGLAASSFSVFGRLGAVFMSGYWIYCHVRLTQFLENAAYFVNEPHHVPSARVVSLPAVEQKPRTSSRPIPAPAPAGAPVIVVAPELRPAPAPRAESSPDDPAEGPRFLS